MPEESGILLRGEKAEHVFSDVWYSHVDERVVKTTIIQRYGRSVSSMDIAQL